MNPELSIRWVIFSTGCHNKSSYGVCCSSAWDRANTAFPFTSDPICVSGHLSITPAITSFSDFGNIPSKPAIIRVHISFQVAQMFSVSWILWIGQCKKWLKGTCFFLKKMSVTRSEAGGGLWDLCPLSSCLQLWHHSCWMCPEWARLPGLGVVLPVWIVYTAGKILEIKLMFYCRALIIWNRIWN